MKKTDQKTIQDKISAREAELRQLIEEHQKMMDQVQKITAQNQVKANHLEGMIAQLKELLPKPKPEKVAKPEKK